MFDRKDSSWHNTFPVLNGNPDYMVGCPNCGIGIAVGLACSVCWPLVPARVQRLAIDAQAIDEESISGLALARWVVTGYFISARMKR